MKIYSRATLFFSMAVMFFLIILASCAPRTTPQLTALPTSTGTVSPAPALNSTQTPIPTPVIYPTQVYGLLTSPDGTKRVQSYDWKTFDVLNADGTVLWSFTYDVNKFGPDSADILLEAGYSPFYWSKDGKYIYITCGHGGDVNSSTKFLGNAFMDGCGVFRFDVETGEMTDIIPEILPGYYAFSISPDGNQLVYTNQTETPVTIKLLDLNTNKESLLLTANEKVLETGSFGWSPQGDKLMFMTLEMSEDENRFYSIFILDLKSLNTQIVVKDIDTWLAFDSWNELGQLLYRDSDRNTWQLSIDSQELSLIATKTPWPSITLTSTPKP